MDRHQGFCTTLLKEPKRTPMETRPQRRVPRSCAAFSLMLACLIPTAPTSVLARSPKNNVLGIRIGMHRADVHHRLQKLGTLEKEVRGRQEVWKLTREPRFASVLVGFDPNFQVRYVTAISRDGQRMRYGEIGPIKNAFAESAAGVYTRYTWEIKPDKKTPGYFLIAEGRDPEYLHSFSIKRHN